MKIVLSAKDRAYIEKTRRKSIYRAHAFGYGQIHGYKAGGVSQQKSRPETGGGPRKPLPAKGNSQYERDLSTLLASDEKVLGSALDLLLSGMKRGAKADKEAVEYLLAAARYRRVSQSCYDDWVREYHETLKCYEASIPFVSLVSGVTSNIGNMLQDGADAVKNLGKDVGKVTQRILFDLPRRDPATQ